MPKTAILKYALILLLFLPANAFSNSQEIKEYKVMKGDTLWDISKKELNDPFLWPKVWKENPGIMNPDKLFPGRMIKIPLYLIQKEQPEEKAAPRPAATPQEPLPEKAGAQNESPRIEEHPLVDKSLLIASGYIADIIPGVGKVMDSPSGRTLFGTDDIVYVALDVPAHVGETFYVIKVSGPVKHPVTRQKIGYVVTISGVAEIVKIENGEPMAKITKCFGEINTGNHLVAYYDIEPPMTTGHFRSPDINGMLVAASSRDMFNSKLDIVYIDKGCKDGIATGDLFRTLAVGAHAVPNGVIQVISCRDHTATAVIEDSSAPVSPGDIFAELKQ